VKSKCFDVLINGFSICGKGEEFRLGHMTAIHGDYCWCSLKGKGGFAGTITLLDMFGFEGAIYGS
jgi:hypothetical protein